MTATMRPLPINYPGAPAVAVAGRPYITPRELDTMRAELARVAVAYRVTLTRAELERAALDLAATISDHREAAAVAERDAAEALAARMRGER